MSLSDLYQTYGPYNINTSSKNNNNNACDGEGTVKYLYIDTTTSNPIVGLAGDLDRTNPLYTFYVSFYKNSTNCYIYSISSNNVYYYIGKDVIPPTTTVYTSNSDLSSIVWNLSQAVSQNGTTVLSQISSLPYNMDLYVNWAAYPIGSTSTYWWLNYVKSGNNYSNNNQIFLDTISKKNDTPLNTGNGEQSCFYYFRFISQSS